jgi:heptosyltransferase I
MHDNSESGVYHRCHEHDRFRHDCVVHPHRDMSARIRSVCVLRLSALGDVCHTSPLVRALQDQIPDAHVTWVVGKPEARLASLISGVELIDYDKRSGLPGLLALRRRLAGRRFDVLLLTQRSFRANALSTMISARLRIGYDRARSKELHGLVVNRRIQAATRDQHVTDCLLSFLVPLGFTAPVVPRWDFAVSAADEAFAARIAPDDVPTMIISAASSHAERNWSASRYAAVADYAIDRYGMRVVLCGGPGAGEAALGRSIAAGMHSPVTNIIGRDTLGGFLALARRAKVVLTPDSGPAHLADAMGTLVLGLYAATDARRSGPRRSRHLCINRFDEAARRFLGKTADTLPWGRHIHHAGVMDLISIEDVIEVLDSIMAGTTLVRPTSSRAAHTSAEAANQ